MVRGLKKYITKPGFGREKVIGKEKKVTFTNTNLNKVFKTVSRLNSKRERIFIFKFVLYMG